ncbi:hypothetical protein FXV83_02640 [Bradyrhizobium hipponense]|uniref:Uncharacterized protein n=1 Tax=Bradyrhizobium hipponense TaxID=2605638 RepID=A0A5S4YUY3_9BRAD|nr:hypothetical protein [Bradyrhizobium hipponense]TYO68170.1 hypothetical protein FXV83_02640 [Bradyrhizobium hipponense]
MFQLRNRDSVGCHGAAHAKLEALTDETPGALKMIHFAGLLARSRELSHDAFGSRRNWQSRSHFKARNGTHAHPFSRRSIARFPSLGTLEYHF